MQTLKYFLFFSILCFSLGSAQASSTASDPELKKLLQKAIEENARFQDRFEAEVWFTDMNQRLKRRVKDNEERLSLLNMIHREARLANLQPELVMAVIQIESNFDRWAISSVGARGLMQVMPFWLKEIGRPGDDLFNAQTNLRMGCTILRHYLDKEKGNLVKALGRYNGSLGSFKYPNKVMTALRKNWYRP